MGEAAGGQNERARALLISVAEQLKVPLTVIARQAELGLLTGGMAKVDATTIVSQTTTALTLVDSYLLGLELLQQQAQLELEPVSLSSLLTDVAHDLEQYAKSYQVHLEVAIAGKYGPIMGHSKGLKAALLSLGFALAEAQAAQEVQGPKRLVLGLHHTPHGTITGIYGNYQSLSVPAWRAALRLNGRARQPIRSLSASTGAGLFVADTIMQAMETRLRVGRYKGQQGLAATFLPSQQLQLV